MWLEPPWWILPAALALDLVLADPPHWPHPVRWMGRAIAWAEPRFRALPMPTAVQGRLFAIALIVGAGGITALVLAAGAALHPGIGTALTVVTLYWCLSARGLADAALAVFAGLRTQHLQQARRALAMIVGREVEALDRQGMTRAAVETVAENFVDGVIAPLFFFAIGGAPLAMGYKMVNTLDSMVGYRNDRYGEFGRAAARIDDGANYLPARLSIPLIAAAAQLLNGRGRRAWATASREGHRHTSPNAGFPEAAFAGALGIRLGGPSRYHGRVVRKPFIGTAFGPAAAGHIARACELMILATLMGAGLTTALLWGLTYG
jgi:adenosylcobinamide-phosphate synthase